MFIRFILSTNKNTYMFITGAKRHLFLSREYQPCKSTQHAKSYMLKGRLRSVCGTLVIRQPMPSHGHCPCLHEQQVQYKTIQYIYSALHIYKNVYSLRHKYKWEVLRTFKLNINTSIILVYRGAKILYIKLIICYGLITDFLNS